MDKLIEDMAQMWVCSPIAPTHLLTNLMDLFFHTKLIQPRLSSLYQRLSLATVASSAFRRRGKPEQTDSDVRKATCGICGQQGEHVFYEINASGAVSCWGFNDSIGFWSVQTKFNARHCGCYEDGLPPMKSDIAQKEYVPTNEQI